MSPVGAVARRRLEGTRQILRLNWSQYVAGAAVLTAAVTAAAWSGTHPLPRLAALAAAALTGWLLLASVSASWWIYDRSDLYAWTWVLDGLPAPPGRWAVLHAGFDEAGPGLGALLDGPPVAVLDVGRFLPRWTASLRRARRRAPGPPDQAARVDALPLADGAVDTAFVIFAAHELRRCSDRASLFAELARVLGPGGAVVLVEHPRDLANVLVFGPGAWHFHPRGEWLRRAAEAGFSVRAELARTPFVKGWVLCLD